MESSLRAGIALYTAGDVHAAHEPWEVVWLDLPDGDNERLFHGLIQFTAAVYHAHNRNWSGAVGLAESARQYLDPLPGRYRGIDTKSLKAALDQLAADPERIEREPNPPLLYNGRTLTAADLDVEAITIAAAALAEEYEQYDSAIIGAASEYAREEATTARSQIIGLLSTLVDEHTHREIVYDRLEKRVQRRQRKEQDVSGLFE